MTNFNLNNFNLGVDIEEVARFRALVRNRRFLDRIFTAEEIAYCRSKKNRLQHFAVRFAAKEAVWKALSLTIQKSKRPIWHRDIGIKNALDGKPEVRLPRSLAKRTKSIDISLSHTAAYAVAVALVVQR